MAGARCRCRQEVKSHRNSTSCREAEASTLAEQIPWRKDVMQWGCVHPGVTDTSLCLTCPGRESRAGRGGLETSLGMSVLPGGAGRARAALARASSLEDRAADGRRDQLGKNQF